MSAPITLPSPPGLPTPPLLRAGIDVWLTFYNDIHDDCHLGNLRSLLSAEELAQERRFYFADDRKRYLVTRAMVRTVLSRYAPVPPDAWTFSRNDYGRPSIAQAIINNQPLARGLSFNLSHTRGLIALAVSRDRELGVDVENLSARSIPLDVADRFFSAIEIEDLGRIPGHARHDRFFEYWTFKESYIKARGMGLSLPLDGFSFEFPHRDAVRISIAPDLEDVADRWCFWQCRPSADYLMAICAERVEGAPPPISMRQYVPLAAEKAVSLPFSRRSESQ